MCVFVCAWYSHISDHNRNMNIYIKIHQFVVVVVVWFCLFYIVHSLLYVARFWSFLCNCVQNHPKLRVVDPLDYEGQLITRRKDLDHEKYLNLFPQQDVTVGVVMWLMGGLTVTDEWDHVIDEWGHVILGVMVAVMLKDYHFKLHTINLEVQSNFFSSPTICSFW